MAQRRKGLLIVGLGSRDQAIEFSTCPIAFGRPVLSSDHERPGRTLGRVIVDWQVHFLDEPFEAVPATR